MTLKRLCKFILLAFLVLVLTLILLIVIVYLARMISEKQLDDVNPGIQCDKELLNNADILYIIPKFNNISIAENKTWCDEILRLNKTLSLHGVYHTYNEFSTTRTEEYLEEGIRIFEECFNKTPSSFKPPQMAISKENIKMIEKKLKLITPLNQIFHKAYHCSDTGAYKNWQMDLF